MSIRFHNQSNRKYLNSSKCKQASKIKGFTTIEALAVLAIVGILLAIFVFSYVKFLAGTAVETASKDISSTMNLAREMSISVNSTHRVTFQLNDPSISGRQAYWIDRLSYDTSGNPVWEIQITNIHFVPDRVRITDVGSSDSTFEFIVFRPTGTADPKNIHLINKADDTTDNSNYNTIQTVPSTARAKILPHVKI